MKLKQNLFGKALTIIAGLMLLFIIGTIAYSEYNTSEVTVIVKLKPNEDPFIAMKSICGNNGTIQTVREINKLNNEYEVRIITRKPVKGLIEWLRSSNRVERADIK